MFSSRSLSLLTVLRSKPTLSSSFSLSLPRTFFTNQSIYSSSSSSSSSQSTQTESEIIQRLTRRFQPTQLLVQDISGGCGSFYAISISSSTFKGLSTIQQHRLVNTELKDVIKDIHGLQLKTTSS